VQKRPQNQRFRIRTRCSRLVEVADDENHVDLFVVRDSDNVAEHPAMFLETGLALDRLTDVPIRCVQELHGRSSPTGASPSNGSSGSAAMTDGSRPGGSPPRSEGRLAHAGNGNCTTNGTGISGCDTNIVP